MMRQLILNFAILLTFWSTTFAQNSVLDKGQWVKLPVLENKVYKITFQDIIGFGLEANGINPAKIKLYGNGSGMLPQANDSTRIFDLKEIAISLVTQEPDKFQEGDYLLFYGEGADYISFDKKKEVVFYQNHLYTDSNFYFLTLDGDDGLRVSQANTPGGGDELKTGITYDIHEQDLYNILHSGRMWYGEQFDLNTSQTFESSLPAIVPGSEIKVVSSVMSSSTDVASFDLYLNNIQAGSQEIPPNPSGTYSRKGTTAIDTIAINESLINGSKLEIRYDFNKTSGIGYLDYFIVQVEIPLKLSGEYLSFYIGNAAEATNRTVVVENCPPNVIAWDITNPAEPIEMDITVVDGLGQFMIDSNTESVALFNPSEVEFSGAATVIANQNIKGISPIDLLIISPEEFMSTAQKIANLRIEEGIMSKVVSDKAIYNEFSSGKKDISALRDYIRYLYEDSGLKYVLIFGKGTYDPKNITGSGLEKIPIYESRNSLVPLDTYASDDFLGFMENHEGEWQEDNSDDHTMDIGVGRIPVVSLEEAELFLKKLKTYRSKVALGKWRQNVLFVAENGDGNIHQRDAERLTTFIDTTYAHFTTKKIYVDAYPIEVNPGIRKAPEANKEIYNAINNGSLIVNYTGHGNVSQWAKTKIFDTKVIDSLRNNSFLPLFVTATCEFGRHDDTGSKSGGEELLLMKETGAIGAITTARPVFAFANYQLNLAFYNTVFDRKNGVYQHLGDIFMQTKNNSLEGVRNRNFSLLGDPSMKLTYGEEFISLDSLNGKLITESDTLKALSLLNFSGSIRKENQTVDQTFDGKVDILLLDKVQSRQTLGNLGDTPFNYKVRNNVLFKGSASIVNGLFNFSTVLPSDISYNPASGRVVLYAYKSDSLLDASGANIDLLIGRSSSQPILDNEDPTINTFIGDTTFINGQIVNANSLLIIKLEDDNGINTSLNQVGHSITYQLDDNEPVILNEYYASVNDDFGTGWIYYDLPKLSPGSHRLKVTAWDTSNNSGTTIVEFSVGLENQVVISELKNYPNPMNNSTNFSFTHNLGGEDLIIQLEIMNTSGQKVYLESRTYNSAASTIDDWYWDGRNTSGGKLNAGIYIFGINVRSNSTNLSQNLYSRLLITN